MESGSLVILSESLVIGSLVILSAAKDLAQGKEMLHYAQHDTTGPLVILSESLVILSGPLVILSEAKDLSRAARCFAQFPLGEAHGLRVTIEGSSTRDTKRKQQEAPTDEALLRLYHD